MSRVLSESKGFIQDHGYNSDKASCFDELIVTANPFGLSS